MEVYIIKEVSAVESERVEEYNSNILGVYSSKDKAERKAQKIMQDRLALFNDWKALRDEKTGEIASLRKLAENGWLQEQYLSVEKYSVD